MRYYLPTSTSFSSERRRLERFNLELPAKVEVLEPGERQVSNLVTSNISANAAYFQTLHPISEGVRVRLTISIANEIVKKITGFEMRLNIEGRVVRSEPTGMAIQFNEHREIERIRIEKNSYF